MVRTSRFVLAAAALASVATLLLCAQSRLARAQDDALPAFGDYVYFEVLPEVIQRVAPKMPDLARQAGVSGVVMVQALVAKDGLVKDTRVTKSIPMLDAAAVEAVRQWRFEPALSNNRPVACWIAIPVAFDVDGRSIADSLRGVPALPGVPRLDIGLPRSRVTPERIRTPEPRLVFRGAYRIDGSASDTLVVTRDAHEGATLVRPGEWRGAGRFVDGQYRGTFTYLRTARDPRNRGARGTHVGAFFEDGIMRVTGHFTNRDWPDFRVEWSPTDTPLSFYGGKGGKRGGDFNDRTPLPERVHIIELGSGAPYEHPTWPPRSGIEADSTLEHPSWPPEHTRRDFQTVPARADSTKR